MSADPRIYIATEPNSDGEFRILLACYMRERERENRALGGLAVVGAILGLLAVCWWLGTVV